MDFDNRIKGHVTQSLVKALLEDAGYITIPLGIETVVREVISLSKCEYSELGLPNQLRTMPDFLITNKSYDKSYLLEVKYRKKWDTETIESLYSGLSEQIKHWNEFLLLIFLGNHHGDLDTPANRCAIFHLIRSSDGSLCYRSKYDDSIYEWSRAEWKHAKKLDHVFPELKNCKKNLTITKCCEIAKKYPEILDN